MERRTGEPCAVKAASTVPRGAVGEVPKGNSLAAYPTMEQVTQPGEGQTACSRAARHTSVGMHLVFPVSWSGQWGQP